MVSNTATVIFCVALITIIIFIIRSLKVGKLDLLHKLYLWMAAAYGIWITALIIMRFTDPTNINALFALDAWTNGAGTFLPALFLCIAMSFVRGWEKMPKKMWLVFVIPVVTNVVVWTNPIHHLQYQVFSVIRSELVFGPYALVSGVFSYVCLINSLILIGRFAWRNSSRLYRRQCAMIALGGIIPLCVSMMATLTEGLTIAATPLSFIPTVVLNGFAIFRLHLLDIRPMATQRVLDWISDCYLVLSDKGLVISHNIPFEQVFGQRFGISENRYLKDCIKDDDSTQKQIIYNLMTALDSCRESHTNITYEQALTVTTEDGTVQKNYYVAEITALTDGPRLYGFVIMFKDVTQLKRSMQQLQENQRRMMEQERLAFLGQMIGGLAHNLKTPIMSISGCINAAEGLVAEIRDSLGDPDVVEEDYLEICGELDDWCAKVKDATAYMSDIITAIKGQAANVASYYDGGSFTVDELIKRITLLMRHELVSGGCRLVMEYEQAKDCEIQGDINNLVQVMNNLISNAIFAEKQTGGGDVTVTAEKQGGNLILAVKDTGPGVDPRVKAKIFKEMVTNKGNMGTGLGLYISNAVVRGKFDGEVWLKDNPGGGSIFGITIPIDRDNNSNDAAGGLSL